MFYARCALVVVVVALATPSFAEEKGCKSGSGGACDPQVQKGFDDHKKDFEKKHGTAEQRAQDRELKRELNLSEDALKGSRR